MWFDRWNKWFRKLTDKKSVPPEETPNLQTEPSVGSRGEGSHVDRSVAAQRSPSSGASRKAPNPASTLKIGPESTPLVSIRYRWGSVCLTGNFRENNEDQVYVDPHARYFLVADGMGGQCAGERASALAVELITRKLESLIDFDHSPPSEVVKAIDQAVAVANSEIMAMGELDSTCKNMGTTIVFMVIVKNVLYLGGIGDSRAYRLHESQLEQITEDHSLTQALVKAGTISAEEAVTHRYKNVLYRYLGTKEGSTGTHPVRLKPTKGDRYLICSDGIYEGASREAIQRILSNQDDPQLAAEELAQESLNGGSKDNISCVVIHIE